MSYNPIRNPIYYAKIANRRTPGILELEGNSGSPRKWDEVTGYGLSGATLRFTGLGLAKFDTIVSLYTSEEHEEWDQYLALLLPEPKPRVPRSLDFWHPKTEAYRIKTAVILDIAFPKTTEEGVTQILINWQAYRPVKFALAKIEGGKASPEDPYDRILNQDAKELRDVNAQIEALSRG